MIANIITLLVSSLSLTFIGLLYTQIVTYKQQKDVEILIGFLNKFISQNYYNPQSYDRQFNSLLVQPENDYCIRSDTYKYYHPDSIMMDTYTFREYPGLIKQALQQHFFDVLPNVTLHKRNKDLPHKYKFPLQLTLPYAYYDQLLFTFKVGLSSLCLFQNYNHLPQRSSLSHKNQLMTNQLNYLKDIKNKGLHKDCIANATFMPKTYRLFEEAECKQFFSYLNSTEYQNKVKKEGPQFIVKMGLEVHRGRGITMLFPEETEQLREKFQNGYACGEIKTYKLAQQYIGNPFLFKGHKIEFRVYWIVVSTNPLIAYAYDKTLIRRCIYPFDKFSTLKGAHVCNTAIVKKTLYSMLKESENDENDENDNNDNDELITKSTEKTTTNTQTTKTTDSTINQTQNNNKSIPDETNLQDLYIDWKLDYLQELLLKQGKIKNRKWLKQELLPQVDRMIIHAIRSTQQTFVKDSKLGEFFAADFLLTDDLKLHIMEINYNPQTLKTTEARIKQHTKMVQDMVEISNAYLRSRYIRFRKIIDSVLEKVSKEKLKIKELLGQKLEKEINQAYYSRLEPNISISPKNLFRLIMDDGLPGTSKYKDLLQAKCLK
ncbi:unnamed protein product (macronuclear) [Paramecium tetraurelia]|uniref:Tubulin-tyrosine ligase family protein n=1 Tax=Paramecium tetraurelia TaxID=5888 RepID=A0BS95_PARTE|nr:uncharacterized protein GSPATT00031643001 [Paramecium tetraurelia]CAK61412.1 unnamed protein product [Paramecium tetraurelia]|eukprot:XP_001428810.1 hypothetical protein (macronuclear) [Paramecium tetraurelia strain d4-2]